MKQKWHIRDIIDLEYFFYADDENGKQSSQRDRDIYLKYINQTAHGQKSQDAFSKSAIIRYWLHERKNAEKELFKSETIFPGDVFSRGYQLLIYAFIAVGFVVGATVTYSFLYYKGTEPLNVSSYIGIFVITQIFFIAALILIFFLRKTTRLLTNIPIINSLFGILLRRLVLKITKSITKNFSTRRRLNLQAVIGLIRAKTIIYNSIFYWPLFIVSQIFAISFNLGILYATISRVLMSDLAFGWQSTLQIGPQAVHSLIKIISMPWSWFIPPQIAHPTIEQIEGSRIILKNGIYSLSTENLASWWPFLCLAVLFYGLLPRIILFVTAIVVKNNALRNLDFSHSACDKLMLRMETPILNTKGNPTTRKQSVIHIENITSSLDKQKRIVKDAIMSKENAVVFVPDDIFNQCRKAELDSFINDTFGFQLGRIVKTGVDFEQDEKALNFAANVQWKDNVRRVILLQEAWQPPIKETVLFIKKIRNVLGNKAVIGIALIGKPSDTIFTKPKWEDVAIWNQSINKLADPYMRVESLTVSNNG